jgi:hypothetical protein
MPELVLNGMYEVNCSIDGWSGVCEVVSINPDKEFYIKPIDGMPRAFANRDSNGLILVNFNSSYHKAMKIIENPLEDIKINISINDLL